MHSIEDLRAATAKHGSMRAAAVELGLNESTVRRRLNAAGQRSAPASSPSAPAVIKGHIDNGVVLVGSDAHLWPGRVSTAWEAFVRRAQDPEVKMVILNGDVIDGASISRHPDIGWETKPSIAEEIAFAQQQLARLSYDRFSTERRLIWPLGNHDMRFEMYLAANAPALAGIPGTHLKDHFPGWEPCWEIDLNNTVAIKHRWKGGRYDLANNTIYSGWSMVTGHTHSLNVFAYTDRNGTRWGVNTGTLAIPFGPQFINYTEANPVDWRSGHAELTFRDGQLLWPEIHYVINEAERTTAFRGVIYQENPE